MKPLPLYSHFKRLLLAATLPSVIWCVVSLVIYSVLQYYHLVDEVNKVSAMTMARIDDKITDWVAALHVLSASKDLDAERFEDFYAQAQLTLAANKERYFLLLSLEQLYLQR